MPRQKRIVVPGLPHHVTQRGARRQRVFFNVDDYVRYAVLLREYCLECDVEVLQWLAMPNHVHLILVPHNESGLARALRTAHSCYARSVNRREGWNGHLWQSRFFSHPFALGHVLTLARYIAQNPVRAGLVEDIADWRHGSTRHLLRLGEDRTITSDRLRATFDHWPTWLRSAVSEREASLVRRYLGSGKLLAEDTPMSQSA